MRKIILASVSLLALAGAAHAQSVGGIVTPPMANATLFNSTGTLSGSVDLSHTRTQTNTQSNEYRRNDYTGYQGFTQSEHNGGVDVKANGTGVINASTNNSASATFNGAKVAATPGSSTTQTVTERGLGLGGGGIGIGERTTKTETYVPGTPAYNALNNSAVSASNSVVSASVVGAGSAAGSAGGYGASTAGARDESGYSTVDIRQQQWQTNNTWKGSAAITGQK